MKKVGGSHFSTYHRAWSDLTSPLRPPPEAVAAMARALGTPDGPTLLLGVTPELADIVSDLVAVDRNHSMIVHIWPGDTTSRTALVGDWKNMGIASDTFAACVGDGSFGTAQCPGEYAALFAEIARVLRSGAAVVLRTYLRPDANETISALRDAAGAFRNFHAFKLRLGMTLAGEMQNPNVPVQAILDTFNRIFPDRAALAQRTGWKRAHIDTIDFYDGSGAAYSFPSRQELIDLIPPAFSNPGFLSSGRYEMAECCPLLTMRRR